MVRQFGPDNTIEVEVSERGDIQIQDLNQVNQPMITLDKQTWESIVRFVIISMAGNISVDPMKGPIEGGMTQ